MPEQPPLTNRQCEALVKTFEYWYGSVPQILTPFGQWVVTEEGIFSLTTYYDIDISILQSCDWALHMSSKRWVNQEEFKEAYDYALAILFPPKTEV